MITTSLRFELLELESLTTEKEVKASIIQNYEEQVEEMKPKEGAQRKAVVALNEDIGTRRMHTVRTRIGFE